MFQLVFGAVQRCSAKRPGGPAAKDLYFRLWALAHGVAMLALEKQILFDMEPEALLQATNDAIARQPDPPKSARKMS